jgi:hypothetical protein
VIDDPPRRARRIAALYASLYLEDPLLQSWAGLASFVSHEVALALAAPTVAAHALALGNLLIYRSMMPNLLRFRDGVAVEPALADGFALLQEADRVARHDGAAAAILAASAVDALSVVEQRDVAAAIYVAMSNRTAAVLSRVCLFRLGADSAAQVIHFHGSDIRVADQRIAWMREAILPAWERARRTRGEWLRADLDRVRRAGGVRADHLPPRLPAAPGGAT